MNEPFKPVGEKARWRTLVEYFADVERGTTVSFNEMTDLLGVTDRGAIRSAVRQASIALSKDHSRSLVSVRGVGYRVALPDEHVDLAAGQQRKAGRALTRGKNHVDHVDLNGLDDNGKRLIAVAVQAFAYQQAQITRLDLRQADLERAVESVTKRVDRTEAEITERMKRMEERIAELGA